MSEHDPAGRIETRARLRDAAHSDRIVWRTECCGVLMRGQCIDCPVTVPIRPQGDYFVTDFNDTADVRAHRLTRDQREAASIAAWEASEEYRDMLAARKKSFFHEFEEHEHEWFLSRVYLWLVVSVVVGIVALSLWVTGGS